MGELENRVQKLVGPDQNGISDSSRRRLAEALRPSQNGMGFKIQGTVGRVALTNLPVEWFEKKCDA